MTSHLNALELRLSNERVRLANAKTQHERDMRTVWIAQIEKEIAQERTTFGSDPVDTMTDDELLKALKS